MCAFRFLVLLTVFVSVAYSQKPAAKKPTAKAKPKPKPAIASVTHLHAHLPHNQPLILDTVPNLPFCRPGQRFILNHILYICHQFNANQRGFKPFACASSNRVTTSFLTVNTTFDEMFFRYKCERQAKTLLYKPITCLLNHFHIKAGDSLRRGKTEYKCVRDSEGVMKLMQKRILHEFCMPGKQNETLMEQDKCPGMSVGVIYAKFGSGSEVIFDTNKRVIV
ncbi:hypothetical protein AAVH_12599 [Aphelenchoides avenae]|nr:hypothetical protein AAVH_12599 [Aphelenchus avenae]